MVPICMQEAGTGFASKPQTDDAEAGDIALDEEETPVGCVRVCLSLKAEARVARRGQKMSPALGQLPHYPGDNLAQRAPAGECELAIVAAALLSKVTWP